MILSSNCAPTLIFIGFSLIQIIIDLYKGVLNEAFIKFIVMIVFSIILNILCDLGYKVIAWFIVFIPIIMMTLISTLLLKVFGTNPDEKDLRSKIKVKDKDISNNFIDKDGRFYLDNSGNYLSGGNLLNQQKYAYFYDRFNSVERVDRNKHRYEFYDKVEDVYKLNSPPGNLYDLSNNPVKYTIVDYLINIFGENFFNNYISRFFYINYPQTYSSTLNTNYDIRLDKTNQTNNLDSTSYEKKYDETYLLDGQLLFRENRFKKTKDKHPNYSDIEINRIIDNEWNNLTAEQQHRWNTNAQKEINKNNSNKYSNNQPCPINETKQSFKQKTGLNCYEICPPGKERNSLDICVPPCPPGQERLYINGICQNK